MRLAVALFFLAASVSAEEVIEECAAFPFGDHDDYVDSMTQALMRYRQGYYVELKDDFEDKKETYRQNRTYY